MLGFSGVAQAAVTFTAPADNTVLFFDADTDPTATVDVSATNDAAGADMTLGCQYGGDGETLGLGAMTAADGKYSRAVPLATLATYSCRLKAGGGSGPYVSIGRISRTSGANSTIKGFRTYLPGAVGAAEVSDVGGGSAAAEDGGVNQAFAFGAGGLDQGNSAVAGALQLAAKDAGGAATVRVDGVDALTTGAAARTGSGDAGLGFPGMLVGASITDGSMQVIEQEDLVRCVAAAANCSSFEPTGVRLVRTVRLADGGQTVKFADRFTSTDGAAHAVDLGYQIHLPDDDERAQVAYPWAGDTFAEPGTDPVAPTAPGTLVVKRTAAGIFGDTPVHAAVSFATAPQAVDATGAIEVVLRYTKTVPATGALAVDHTLSTDPDGAKARALGTAALPVPEQPPGNTGGGGGGGSGDTGGSGSGGTGGSSGSGGSGGSGGTNTDDSSNNNGGLGDTKPPAVTLGGAPLVDSTGLVTTGAVVACPAGTVDCIATIDATTTTTNGRAVAAAKKAKKIKIGHAQTRVRPGKRAALRFRLNRTGKALLTKRKRLKVSITFVVRRGFAKPVKRVKVVTLRAPRRH